MLKKMISFVAVGAIVYGFAAPRAAWGDIIAVDFNITGEAIPTGNEPDGFLLPVGAFWNALDIGANLGPIRTSDSISSLKLIDGTTTTVTGFNMSGSGTDGYQAFRSGDPNAVRDDVVFLVDGVGFVATMSWEVTGLTPGGSYDLRLFGQSENGNPNNDADFTISNTGGTTINTDDVAVFNSIIADGSGKIVGTLGHTGGASSWSGFEIQGTFIPEPATMSLLAMGGIGVLLKRRRRA